VNTGVSSSEILAAMASIPIPASAACRVGPKAHIQLDIPGADRLMPAKKVSA
jgi:hypothetical protein